jgi:hypothetical protein
MLGALFGLIMLGVGWLVIWSCVDHSKPSETWWPFAMRTRSSVTSAPTETWRRDGSQGGTQPVQTVRQDPNRRWQRSDF